MTMSRARRIPSARRRLSSPNAARPPHREIDVDVVGGPEWIVRYREAQAAAGRFQAMAHELDMPAIQKSSGYDVEHVLKGGERLPDCGGINILHTPGHTAGHISLHLPQKKTLIAGDAILSAGEHLVVSPTYLCSDPDAASESVHRLIAMNLDLERVLVGHGDDVYEGAKNNLGRIFAGPRD